MGAWGTAVFDNDDASDFKYEIEDAGSHDAVCAVLDRAMTSVLESGDFLDSADASVGVAASALVAAWGKPDLLGDSAYGPQQWPMSEDPMAEALKIKAGQALDRAARPGDDNEFFLLWDEAGEWDAVVAEIQRFRTSLP